MAVQRIRRRLRSCSLLLAAFFFVFFSIYIYIKPSSNRFYDAHYTESPVDPFRGRQIAFWNSFRDVLDQYAPNCPPPELNAHAEAVRFDAIQPSARPDLLVVPDDHLEAMKSAHTSFVAEIRRSNTLTPIHTPGSRGLVSMAGGAFFPLFLAQLRMLRRAKSTLPVEVFLRDKSEYEKHLCEKVLPQYNAKCVVLSELLGSTKHKGVEIEHYQFRTFAVLFSSFEEVVWMDAECFPLYRVEDLLDSDPFNSTGLVTWPDFSASTISPLFYHIAQQEVPSMGLRAATKTGVFMISKQSHFLTLLLAAYYNYHGPSHYFALLLQGAPGAGDKEAFIQAATALGEPVYPVSERVETLAHIVDSGETLVSALAQSDPTEDYRLTSEGIWRVQDPAAGKAPRVFFIHSNYPKFDANDNVFGHKWDSSGFHATRLWTTELDTIKRFGYDAEKAYWEELQWVACNYERSFQAWADKSGICSNLQDYWNTVFADVHDEDPQFVSD
ncbi:putative alpha-1,2-mannosyltransferase [Talaromyces proteolyticus]|uniref:Alpha-1,2-mannosyltransferase n=1 Tax=Talaromyces proteolyticus TaxID=1131652 RepID=A0AAD4KPC6_9EURO|nr:putative alpha-1,2-mannosyltransferase [Talaromyces proteolyticus]KAH8696399.1 putative alpha-1,2-mannosyltransferase [Talaromyces proteolyticus]